MVENQAAESQTFSEVVNDWQRRLLQLDRRNNLLNFRPGKSPVRIVDQNPDETVQALLSSNRGLRFDYAESRTRRPYSRLEPVISDEEAEVGHRHGRRTQGIWRTT